MKKRSYGSVEFSRSRRKIIRAGPANMLIPMAAIFCTLAYLIMKDINFPLYIVLIFDLVIFVKFLYLYSIALSRITKRDNIVIFECSLHKIHIQESNIKNIYSVILRLYGQIVFVIIERNRFFPRIFVASKILWDIEAMKLAKEEVEKLINDSISVIPEDSA